MLLCEQMFLYWVQLLVVGNELVGLVYLLVCDVYQKLCCEIYLVVFECVEFECLLWLYQDQVCMEIGVLIVCIFDEEWLLVNDIEWCQFVIDVYDEMFGFGLFEVLLCDFGIFDIFVNIYWQVYVECCGQFELIDVMFYDDVYLMKVIEKIVLCVGCCIDELSLMVDVWLLDGLCVNVIILLFVIDGLLMLIWCFVVNLLKMDDLVCFYSLMLLMVELFDVLLCVKVNVLVLGGIGSGKMMLFNILFGFILCNEWIVMIEDVVEL